MAAQNNEECRHTDRQRLQPRMHVTSESTIRRRVSDTPVVYMLFDVLWLDGHLTMSLPYTDRRKLLEGLDLNGDSWRTPSNHVGDGTCAGGHPAAYGRRRDARPNLAAAGHDERPVPVGTGLWVRVVRPLVVRR